MTRNPWTDFWTGGMTTQKGGCLPDAVKTITPVLEPAWRRFAATLPSRARVVDLATGDGVVLTWLRAARRDLALEGVDSARSLPKAAAGVRLRSNIEMESLPIADCSVDAVTSQFGFEYGETGRIAGEIARILKPGGRLHLVIHHADSVILAHNVERRAALRWAAFDSGILKKARKLARVRALAALPTPASFHQAIEEARREYPDQPVAAEFATAVAQTLHLGRGKPMVETLEVLATLEARARDETGRIDALERAARNSGEFRKLVSQLEQEGLTVSGTGLLCEPNSERAFAWWIEGELPGRPEGSRRGRHRSRKPAT